EDVAAALRRELGADNGRDPAATWAGTTMVPAASGAPEPFRYVAQPLSRESAASLAGTQAPGRVPVAWLVVLMPAAHADAWEAAQERAQRHTRLAHAAAVGIGSTLDLHETTARLAEALVPELADLAAVDLAESVLLGDEPSPVHPRDHRLRRVAVTGAHGGVLGPAAWPAELLTVGEPLPQFADSDLLRPVVEGAAVIVSDMTELRKAFGVPPETVARIMPADAHSMLAIPLFARGKVLGAVTMWRTATPADFDDEDADLMAEIASRAALGVDNARRYTREHRTAVALQRSLLPRPVTRTPAADTTGTYLPAEGDAGVGGDWFDVIALSSLRTGFVVGDVVGHGLGATAAMGRLRTAVQTLADIDLEPDELLSHLDDLVLSYWPEHDPNDPTSELAAQGATFLYAVYDPVSRRCTMASAGHPPPLMLRPGAAPEFVDLPPGPPLGLGGMPFESVEFEVPPGTLLAFFTDGLVERRDRDVTVGLDELRRVVADNRDRPLEDIGPAVLAGLAPARDDDIALLLARTRAVPADAIAEWELAADPAEVGRARELTTRQLGEWGLDDLAFSTELVVSELVTNAIRYAGAPVGLRLIRDEILVCEVSDPSNTQPRLRRAIATDEGGRGLFLVAQLTARWGSRYRRSGKTIWTEQGTDPLGGRGEPWSGLDLTGDDAAEAFLENLDGEW
ncbi:MAG: SpoIIE family protein phosphatase, partial [Streptomycetaceae bacterium]|nr:SpoIIE family protein phosphatase [Streptomycetaceae bacterium]